MIATCPTRNEISDYLLGRLPPQAVDEFSNHIEDCPACSAAAEALESESDPLIARLRDPMPLTWEPTNDTLQSLLDRAAKTPSVGLVTKRIRDYVLLEEIGRGGMGVVYRARHERLGREVAIKLLAPERSGQQQAEARFEREMKAIGQLQHPNMVAALDAGVVDGTYYLTMELIDGCDASHLVDRLEPLPVADACEIVRQAALGLQFAHQRGILHRDLKPSNLLVTRDGVVKIADLGLARFVLAENEGEQTSPNLLQGTLAYLSPEQAEGHVANEQSDCYALGVVLFKLLTGQTPIPVDTNASPLKTLLAHRDYNPPKLRTLLADVPEKVEALVARLLKKNPAERPAEASEIATALEPFCKGVNLAGLIAAADDPKNELVRQSSLQFAPVPTRRFHRFGWAAALVAALAIVAGVLFAANYRANSGSDKQTYSLSPAAKEDGIQAAQQRQREWAQKLGINVQQQNSIGMELTLIPPGEFTMGSPATEVERAISIEAREVPEAWYMDFLSKARAEFPAHKVKLTRPFLMGTHEVTVDQWDAFVEETGYERLAEREPDRYGDEGFGQGQSKPDGATPMIFVTWDDAQTFCNWLSTKEGKAYRLPTEAEWEYACRAGTTTRWFTGDNVESLRGYAWTLQSCGKPRSPDQNSADARPEKVGGKKPNPFGLFDMTGNAWEWCRDYYLQEYYSISPKTDPAGAKALADKTSPDTNVVRGGGIGFRENECRSATRWFRRPNDAMYYLGFRVVRELDDDALAQLTSASSDNGVHEAQPVPLDRDDESARAAANEIAVQETRQRQREWAEKLGVNVQQQNSIGMELTLLPPGKFTMGSSAPEVQRSIEIEQREVPEGWVIGYFNSKVRAEYPPHEVKLTRPFLMGTYEVTVDQWDAFVKETGYERLADHKPERFGSEGYGHDQTRPDGATPMIFVTWDDAQAFCNWLSTKEGKTYRLPTEAEWEYACRAGTTTRWFTGDDVESLRDYAWTLQSCGKVRSPDQNSADVRPVAVGGKKPNPFGLYDITGNAWEWCRDHFSLDYYGYSPKEDPPGATALDEKSYPGTIVVRGGGIGFRENECRSATRWLFGPQTAKYYLGFRVVCELKDESGQ